MQLAPLRISLADINAQLTQLSSPRQISVEKRIALHEKRAGLTEEKIRLQNSINSFTYPILTLPTEITSEFFVCCLPDTPTLPDEAIAPMLLTRICRQWRQIALDEPRLWASLKIDARTRVRCIVQDWLPRARSMPQTHSVVVEGFGENWHDEAEYEEDERPPFSEGRREHYFVRFWEHLTSFIGKRFSVDGVLELLRRVPRLIHCDLIEVYMLRSPSVIRHTPVLHTHLKSLIFRWDEKSRVVFSHNIHGFELFQWLQVPALRRLDLRNSFHFNSVNVDLSVFHTFLINAPAIEYLAAKLDGDGWSGSTNGEILQALPKIPSLMNLKLDTDDENIVFGLVHKLLDPHFLPHIQKITLVELGWNDDFFCEEEQIQILVAALNSRSETTPDVAQLLDFTFIINADIIDSDVEPELDDALRELRAKGMKIHIGPGKRLN